MLTMNFRELLPSNQLLCCQLLELLGDVPERSPSDRLLWRFDVGMLCSAIKHGTAASSSGSHISSGSAELAEGN